MPFTVETTVLPSFARQRDLYLGGASSSHDPNFSRAAASEGSMTVSVVQAQGVVWDVLAGRCLAVIPRLPCLIFGPCRRLTLPLVFSREAA